MKTWQQVWTLVGAKFKQSFTSVKIAPMIYITILYPVIMNLIIPNDVSPIERQAFVMVMFFSFLGSVSPITLAMLNLTEDKEHKTLRILLDRHVRPWVYLLSLVIMTQITMWVTVMISLPLMNLDYQYLGSIFGMIFHFGMCFLISSILGLIFGLIFDRSATANAASIVPMLAIAFIPLFSRMNDHLAGLMPYFYTGRANAWLLHLDYGGLGIDMLVYGVWLLASLIVLTISYRQKRNRLYL